MSTETERVGAGREEGKKKKIKKGILFASFHFECRWLDSSRELAAAAAAAVSVEPHEN